MPKIYKYKLKVTDYSLLILPLGSQILTCQIQDQEACLWVLLSDSDLSEDRHILMIGTGHDIMDSTGMLYISTIQFNDYGLVFHVFEGTSK